MKHEAERRPIRTINTDFSPESVVAGEYTYAMNIRSAGSVGKEVGVVGPIEGAKRIQVDLPAGQNTVIGRYSDERTREIYWLVHNSLGSHVIFRYGYALEIVQQVFLHPILNFSLENYICEFYLNNDQLVFHDPGNEVRRLDLSRVLGYVDSEIWDFDSCIISNGIFAPEGLVVLTGTSTPPFTVGQTITVIREWRKAWIDYEYQDVDDSDLALFHECDPNPSYSGEHEVVAVFGNSVAISATDTGVVDYVQSGPDISFIPGRAYQHVPGRRFTLPLQDHMITLYRPSPGFPPVAHYRANEKKRTNELRGGLYQFRTRYVYANNMKSLMGPVSKIPLPILEKNSIQQDTPVWYDNEIEVCFDTGDRDVDFVELCVRESSNAENQSWSVVKTFDKEAEGIVSNTSHKYVFTGEELRVTIPDNEAEAPHDFLPERVSAMTFLRDKRVAVAGGLEGSESHPVNIDIEPVKISGSTTNGQVVVTFPTGEEGAQPAVATSDLLPAVRTIFFPNNKVEISGGRLRTGAPAIHDPDTAYNPGTDFEKMPFWRGRPSQINPPSGGFAMGVNPASGPVAESVFDGTGIILPYPAGWELANVSPSIAGWYNQPPGTGTKIGTYAWDNTFTHPWVVAGFTIQDQDGNLGAFAPGAIVTLTVRVSVSRFLGFFPRNIATQDFFWEGDEPLFYEDDNSTATLHNGAVMYERHENDPQESYRLLEHVFTKVVMPGEAATDVRNHFLDLIDGFDLGTHDLMLAAFSADSSGTVWAWTGTSVEVTLRASQFPDFPGYGGPPELPGLDSYIFIRADVSVPPISGVSPIFEPGLTQVRRWYNYIGVNNIRATANVSRVDGTRGFKTGASHALALEYRSIFGRRQIVSPAGFQYVPYFNQVPGPQTDKGVGFRLRVSNPAPADAAYWQVMYGGNMSMLKWLVFEVDWIDSSGGSLKIALSKRVNKYNANNNSLDDDEVTELVGRSELSYGWTRGDRLRFITFWTGDQTNPGSATEAQDVYTTQFIDVEIIGEAQDTSGDEMGIVIMVDKAGVMPYVTSNIFGSGSLVEVYSPRAKASEDQIIYREIGECFKVDDGSHWGNRLNQGPNTPGQDTPWADVLIKNTGDAFAIGRRKVVSQRSRDRAVESPNFSDFYDSTTWGGGVANVFDPFAKKTRIQNIRYSDFFVALRNNINRFFSGNVYNGVDIDQGTIQRIETAGMSLFVFQEDGVAIIPIGAQELTTADGQGTVFRSDGVLGKASYVPFGIANNREGLTVFSGTFFYPSVNNGVFLMMPAGSMPVPISREGRDNDWQTLSDQIRRSRPKVRILSAFDPEHSELIIHVPQFFEGAPFVGQRPSGGVTFGYSLDKKGWSTDYPFMPESIGTHGNKLISFKRGELYIHNVDRDNYNKYYHGEAVVDSEIEFSFNDFPEVMKVLKNIAIASDAEPIEVIFRSNYSGGQQSSLIAEDFIFENGHFRAAVLRDELTPGVDLPIINGDELRGGYFTCRLKFSSSSNFRLLLVSLLTRLSQKTIQK